MSCRKSDSGYHTEVQVETFEIPVGNELVMFSRIECSVCGEGIRNQQISRRKNPDVT